ncbi:Immunoglobulin domain-containing protein-like protein [Camelus ferus]|nr:Immunoglobulin domain-containing protein-like protein [Camelus ferus]
MALLVPASSVLSALVALMVFRASAWACLLCFTSYNERLQICQIFAGLESPDLGKCEEAFTDAFKGLLDTEINYDERGHLHDAFTQMTHFLQEMATAQAQACIPPCGKHFIQSSELLGEVVGAATGDWEEWESTGLQEVARRFRCRGCYSTVCDLPLDCPVKDVTVTRGQQAMFSCTVNFQLPKEEITYSWKFAGGVSQGGTSAKGLGGGLYFPGGCGVRTERVDKL